ncbi:MAG: right-handed parallel beta-helix repeat-containing protein [Bacteroidales bacterium]|nr:right-handed parallel beta-helix repeat-containing protein [Bacteroidales bacterium]
MNNKKSINLQTMESLRIYLTGVLITMIYCSLSYEVRAEEPVKFYVSLNGNDSNKGTIDRPFATLEAAQKAVRDAKKNNLNRPVEVVIREGIYYLQQTLELKPEDSGTKEAPVTWLAAENERVILSGGRIISGMWKKDYDGKIWYVDLPSTKGWIREVTQPEVYQKLPIGSWHFRQLYIDEKKAIRARFPNANEQNPFLYAIDGSMEYVRLSDGEVKSSWGDEPDAQINIVPQWRFFNQWNDVTGVNVKESTITIGPRERHALMNKGSWFWIEGVKSELDQPGEWYLDTKIGRLYYLPEPGQEPNNQKIIAPLLNRIVYLKGDVEKGTHVTYVNFRGLEFRHTTYTLGQIEARVHTDGAVMFENATNCSIEECTFENIGGYALWLHLDSKDNSFCRNTVINSGGGGVLLTGSRFSYMDDSKIYTHGEAAAKVAPYLTEITHNTVKHCGQIRYYGGGVHIDSRPASMTMMPGNHIAHNHFQDLSRNGVFAFRNQGGNVVEFNEIHDCLQTTIDGACIHFASMNRFNAPNYILNNYLYDMWGYMQNPDGKPQRMLANGVFLDWATSNTTIKNNVIYNSGEKEIKTIMGNWNLDIENNLVSKTRIEPFLAQEVGPQGTASHSINPENLKSVGGVILSSDKEHVQYSGSWEQVSVTGMWGLFEANYLHACPEKAARCEYQLSVKESGIYKICMMYFPDEKNASNAKITVNHSKGEEIINWNFKKGDQYGFAVVLGEYYLDKDKPASVTISNTDADGFIVADGVGFIKVNN